MSDDRLKKTLAEIVRIWDSVQVCSHGCMNEGDVFDGAECQRHHRNPWRAAMARARKLLAEDAAEKKLN